MSSVTSSAWCAPPVKFSNASRTDFGVHEEEAIHVIEGARGIGAERHAGECALEHGGEKRGAESFAGNISDEKRGAAIAEREDIKVVPSDRQAGKIEPGNGEVREFAEITR